MILELTADSSVLADSPDRGPDSSDDALDAYSQAGGGCCRACRRRRCERLCRRSGRSRSRSWRRGVWGGGNSGWLHFDQRARGAKRAGCSRRFRGWAECSCRRGWSRSRHRPRRATCSGRRASVRTPVDVSPLTRWTTRRGRGKPVRIRVNGVGGCGQRLGPFTAQSSGATH